MPKLEKLIDRLKSKPTDFKWAELQSLMGKLGYEEVTGNGSRVKFVHPKTGHKLSLHKPHPRPEIKAYLIQYLVEALTEQGLI